jgi:hypothetical protein
VKIIIESNFSTGVPEFNGELSRISVLLGVNGAGKSKLLLAIQNQLSSVIRTDQILRFMPGKKFDDLTLQLQSPVKSLEQQREGKVDKRERIADPTETLNLLFARETAEGRIYLQKKNRGEDPEMPRFIMNEVLQFFNEIFSPNISFDEARAC